MIHTADLKAMLEACGALRHGHFLLSSGRHSRDYIQCALLLEAPARARQIGRELARLVAEFRPSSIVSPALGGLVIGYQVASELDLLFRFVERADGVMQLRRGFTIGRGERVAVIEDVVTTGRSTGETIETIERAGGRVVGVGSIIDRASDDVAFDAPHRSLAHWALKTYPAAACPLCATGEPLEKPGSRSTNEKGL